MGNNQIKCPHCGKDIELTEVLTHSIRESMKAELGSELAKKEQEFAQQQAGLKQREKELTTKQESIDEQVNEKLKAERLKIAEQKRDLETQQQQIDEQVAAKLKQEKQKFSEDALKKAKEEQAEQSKALQTELDEKNQKLKAFQQQELELRKQQRKLQEEKEAFELDAARTLDAERKKISEEAGKKAAEEQQLKMREKDDQLDAMKKQIDDLKRKSEIGSQEAQGEAMEGSLKDKLSQIFPFDVFDDVKKGIRGADIVQRIRNLVGKECGTILWETKNTQAFSKDWIEKLKKDQQEAQAELAVIATITLPKEIKGFGIIDDIWITDYQTAICLATALRYGLISVAREKLVVTNQSTVKDIVYRYVTGQEFTLQVKSIVAAFGRMKDDLESEKRAMQKYWKSREKQIETVLGGVSNIYGAIEGYVGQKQLPQIDPLLLDTAPEDE